MDKQHHNPEYGLGTTPDSPQEAHATSDANFSSRIAPEKKPPQRTHIYVDVDGVLADFVEGVGNHFEKEYFRSYLELCNRMLFEPEASISLIIPPEAILGISLDDMMKSVESNTKFWETLPKISSGERLLYMVLAVSSLSEGRITWSFLTRPSPHCETFEEQRSKWLSNFLSDMALFPLTLNNIPINIVPNFAVEFAQNKGEFAKFQRDNGVIPVLIDDDMSNIESFQKNHGLGILFPSTMNRHVRPSEDNLMIIFQTLLSL